MNAAASIHRSSYVCVRSSNSAESLNKENVMTRYGSMRCFAAAVALFGLSSGLALADETVTIGGSRAGLIKPKAPRARGILMPGGDGSIRAGDKGDGHGLTRNLLGRTRHASAGRCLAALAGAA